MLTLLADCDVLFVIRLGFGTGNVAHGIHLSVIIKSIKLAHISLDYSIYRYLSTHYYYILWFLDENQRFLYDRMINQHHQFLRAKPDADFITAT